MRRSTAPLQALRTSHCYLPEGDEAKLLDWSHHQDQETSSQQKTKEYPQKKTAALIPTRFLSTFYSMFLPELYDLVYSHDQAKISEYYRTNRVFTLGEYAILSLGEHYKYKLLPHFIVRGGHGEARWSVLNILRSLRVALFFERSEFIDLLRDLCEALQVVETFVEAN
jgi:hypothetical protein